MPGSIYSDCGRLAGVCLHEVLQHRPEELRKVVEQVEDVFLYQQQVLLPRESESVKKTLQVELVRQTAR